MIKRLLMALTLVTATVDLYAVDLDEAGTLTLTGFYQITGAEVLSGSSSMTSSPWKFQQPFANPSIATWTCPCSIQNWEYASVYEKSKGFQIDQESLAGIQIKKEFNANVSATAQVLVRANNPNDHSRPTVDWAYLTWVPEENSPWTVQVGKFRIPLFYYSDYLYIGYAYQWVRPSSDVYGWPIFDYTGGNIGYRGQIGLSDWTLNSQVWSGSSTSNSDIYDTQIYYGFPTNESWKKIVGGYASVTNNIIDVRAMIMQYRDDIWQNGPGGQRQVVSGVDHLFTRIEGLSFNLDYDHFIVRNELDRSQQYSSTPGVGNVYKYMLTGVGYNLGTVTPMYTFSKYRYITPPIEGRDTQTFSVRWDFRKNTALKFQYDHSRDASQYAVPFFGDSSLASVSLQGIF